MITLRFLIDISLEMMVSQNKTTVALLPPHLQFHLSSNLGMPSTFSS